MKAKSLDCLRLTSMSPEPDRTAFLHELYRKYSEKAIDRKLERLADRGYIEYGVSPRWGWLTDKGREALKEAGYAID